MQQLSQEIQLKDLETIPNYRDTAPPTQKDPDIIELAANIAKDDVLQNILVRPHPKKHGKFQVIFGYRRWIASLLAGLATIPANIKDIADDDILEIQVTENLQRKDVHPMDEAVAYKSLMQKKNYTVQELSSRFAKSAEYITQRLKLNDLAADLQKDFRHDQMNLGQALELCRLSPADQAEIKSYFKGFFLNVSVAQVMHYISENIIRQLNKAPFDTKDASLVPAAGPCTICPKRSGTGNLLFKDVKETDRCFDGKCFQRKCDIAFKEKIREIVTAHPEVHLLMEYSGKISSEINTELQKMKIKVLRESDDFRVHNYFSGFHKKAKGFWIDGPKRGTLTAIFLKGEEKTKAVSKAAGSVKEDPSVIIAGIKERTKRAAELDGEKVYGRILEAIKKHRTQSTIDQKLKTTPVPETIAMLLIVLAYADYTATRDIEKKLGITGTPEKVYKKLLGLSHGEITWMIRRSFFSKHSRTEEVNADTGYVLRKMAESYKDIPVATFEAEQKQIREKREKAAKERIIDIGVKDLQARSAKGRGIGTSKKKAAA